MKKKIWRRRARRMGLSAVVAGIVAVNYAQEQRDLDLKTLEAWQSEVAQAVIPTELNASIFKMAYLEPAFNSISLAEKEAQLKREADIALFRQTARATALDLFGTGHVSVDRARGLAAVIVSEATKQKVPVPLVLGVMRVENDIFKSRARSIVGATGLMQIMPRIWLPSLGRKYGWDLENDTTNVKMGIAILAIYLNKHQGDWRTALLRYNGCVRSTNTPRCWTYPDKVERAVRRDAKWLCRDKELDHCITEPLAIGVATKKELITPAVFINEGRPPQ